MSSGLYLYALVTVANLSGPYTVSQCLTNDSQSLTAHPQIASHLACLTSQMFHRASHLGAPANQTKITKRVEGLHLVWRVYTFHGLQHGMPSSLVQQ